MDRDLRIVILITVGFILGNFYLVLWEGRDGPPFSEIKKQINKNYIELYEE